MGKSIIEWTDRQYKTVAGCRRVGKGCDHCYAVDLARRYKGRAESLGLDSPYLDVVSKDSEHFTGVVNLIEGSIAKPLAWKCEPCPVFVNSEADTFHELVPDNWIDAMFAVMTDPRMQGFWWQILTKRSERLQELGPALSWTNDIWAGVSVENADVLPRVDDLKACSAKKKWLSVEPLLGPLDDLDVTGIDWVVVGGESKNGSDPQRATELAWVQDIYRKCEEQGVPFFFKQWGMRAYNPLLMPTHNREAIGDLTADKYRAAAEGLAHGKGGCMFRKKPGAKPGVVREVPSEYQYMFDRKVN